jgi:hypothetical protein
VRIPTLASEVRSKILSPIREWISFWIGRRLMGELSTRSKGGRPLRLFLADWGRCRVRVCSWFRLVIFANHSLSPKWCEEVPGRNWRLRLACSCTFPFLPDGGNSVFSGRAGWKQGQASHSEVAPTLLLRWWCVFCLKIEGVLRTYLRA